jgi:predicted MFS family arabinose efflux permease
MLGPLIVALALYMKEGYQFSFIILLIPALCSLSILFLARQQYPHPRDLEIKVPNLKINSNLALFWIYLTASACVAAGFIDFPLMAYHFQDQHIFSPVLIPLAYALAMGMDALFSPILGFCYDRFGFITLIIVTLISALFAPLVFLTTHVIFIYLGVVLWAVGIGARASIMRTVVGKITPPEKRASFYGVFNMGFGLAWFLGSLALGWLYEHSILAMVLLSLGLQLLALPLLLLAFFKQKSG